MFAEGGLVYILTFPSCRQSQPQKFPSCLSLSTKGIVHNDTRLPHLQSQAYSAETPVIHIIFFFSLSSNAIDPQLLSPVHNLRCPCTILLVLYSRSLSSILGFGPQVTL